MEKKQILCLKSSGFFLCIFCFEGDEYLKCHVKIDPNLQLFPSPYSSCFSSAVNLILQVSSVLVKNSNLVESPSSDQILVLWTYFDPFRHFRYHSRNLGLFWSIVTIFFSISNLIHDFINSPVFLVVVSVFETSKLIPLNNFPDRFKDRLRKKSCYIVLGPLISTRRQMTNDYHLSYKS